MNRLLGKTIYKYERGLLKVSLFCTSGDIFTMYHKRSCCEKIEIDTNHNDLEDILNSPVTFFERQATGDVVIPPTHTDSEEFDEEDYEMINEDGLTFSSSETSFFIGTANQKVCELVFRIYSEDMCGNGIVYTKWSKE